MPVNAGFGPEDSVASDILSGDPASGLGTVFEEEASRNGFRETGRGGGSKGESCPSDKEGDAARLRKGLLEERLSVSPGDGRESTARNRILLLADGFMHFHDGELGAREGFETRRWST